MAMIGSKLGNVILYRKDIVKLACECVGDFCETVDKCSKGGRT
jgi:hypothetical protein